MKCNDFDALIDEMLSGVLQPDANQHMRQCERCSSHYRARAAVQDGLRKLALASAPGPSLATDRAVMNAYRELQQRRIALGQPQSSAPPQSLPRPAAKVLTFPGRPAPARSARHWNSRSLGSRNWWSAASAAAVLLAVLGMGLHLRNGVPTVSAPTVATVPAASALPGGAAACASAERTIATARLASRHSLLTAVSRPGSQTASQPRVVEAVQRNEASSEVASVAPDSAPVTQPMTQPATQPQGNAPPIIHLARAGAAGNAAANVAQSASSTWPGYSNLMYCDPVVCSGPMQVIHIKVPVGQVKPNVGQSEGNSFVNADVVVGPDGVARAIRVAN